MPLLHLHHSVLAAVAMQTIAWRQFQVTWILLITSTKLRIEAALLDTMELITEEKASLPIFLVYDLYLFV